MRFFVLVLLLLLDAALALPGGSWPLSLHLSTLWLLYGAFRGRLKWIWVELIIFVILTHAFSGANPVAMFAVYGAVLFGLRAAQDQIYTESYITQSVWIFLSVMILKLLLVGSLWQRIIWHEGFSIMMRCLLGASVTAVLSIPSFLIWDSLFETRERGRR